MLEKLGGEEAHAYTTTLDRLLAHCLTEHRINVDTFSKAFRYHYPYKIDETGLAAAMAREGDRLLDEALARWDHFLGTERFNIVMGLLAGNASKASFQRLWARTFQADTLRKNPAVASTVFRAAAFSEEHSSLAKALLSSRLAEAFRSFPSDLVFTILRAPPLSSARESYLEALVSAEPKSAAVVIHECEHIDELPRALILAVENVDKSDSSTRLVGLALLLRLDARYALPKIVKAVNEEHDSAVYNQTFEWLLQQADQNPVFTALAQDAVSRDLPWQPLLASIHSRLIENVSVVINWLRENSARAEAKVYAGQLMVEYLSEAGLSEDAKHALVELARGLHRQFGTRDEKRIRLELNLTAPTTDERLIGIALAKDVVNPPEHVDPSSLVKVLKSLPNTYRALGGSKAERDIKAGLLPPFSHWYAADLEAERQEIRSMPPNQRSVLEHRFQMMETFRNSWESRFAILHEKQFPIPSESLRRDPSIWTEMRLVSRLVTLFKVTYEPTGLPGLGTKRPDFLLECADGSIILEVATIGRKPEDVSEGVKTSSGGTAKKTLLNKLHDKFGDCAGDAGRPIVIAVQAGWAFDLEYDLPASLYGPLTFSWTQDREGKVLEEGTSRDTSKAFFMRPDVGCISAVIGLVPRDADSGFAGEIYRPLLTPRHPLGDRLWVRLRDALFDPVPQNLVSAMRSVPTMSTEEARDLVAHGIDEIGFFALQNPSRPPGIAMSEYRYQELRLEALRLIRIHQTGDLRLLRAATEVDLEPLFRAGIFTTYQLKRGVRPDLFPRSNWESMLKELETLDTPMEDYHEDLMAMLKRRAFLQPAYEIYGGLAGFYDYGPLGAGLKRNIEDAWRRVYVLGEGFAEVQTPTISPEPVFRASGHLASFQDPLVECGQCGANLRADKLLEEVDPAKVGKAAAAQVEARFGKPLAEVNWGTLKLPDFDAALAALQVKCPECGQHAWGAAHHFNLMFRSPVGPGQRAKDAYLRPETAQGMFTVFPWLYRYFRERLPFGAVQLGKAYRNEIAPRQALLRLREFHQMEAEVFFHPERKTHRGFGAVAQDELPLVPAAGRTREEVKAGAIVRMRVGDAVKKGVVAHEALAYFLWLTHHYLVGLGLPSFRLRFRQHAREEMAHYSSDTWDCEYLSPRFGWVEIVGIADRTNYDLTAHAKVSGERLAHFERFPEPREVEHEKVLPDRAKIGKHFKADAGAVMGALAALPPEQARGHAHVEVHGGGKTFRVPAEMFKVERVKEKVAGDYIVPHVVEPSYGVDRILYSVLEANYKPATKEREWATLTLPPAVAPLTVGVFPLMGKDNLDTTAQNIEEDLRRSGVMAQYDDSGSIGKRYARMDEAGAPLCVTIDYDTLEQGTVTLRDRDSGAQKRVPRRALLEAVQAILAGKSFPDLPHPDVPPG